jgi:hypothetical protein
MSDSPEVGRASRYARLSGEANHPSGARPSKCIIIFLERASSASLDPDLIPALTICRRREIGTVRACACERSGAVEAGSNEGGVAKRREKLRMDLCWQSGRFLKLSSSLSR